MIERRDFRLAVVGERGLVHVEADPHLLARGGLDGRRSASARAPIRSSPARPRPRARPEWAVRMPAFVLAAVGAYILYNGVSRTCGRRAGFIGGVVLLTMPGYALLSHQALTDMPLVASVAASLGFLLRALETRDEAQVSRWTVRLGGRSSRSTPVTAWRWCCSSSRFRSSWCFSRLTFTSTRPGCIRRRSPARGLAACVHAARSAGVRAGRRRACAPPARPPGHGLDAHPGVAHRAARRRDARVAPLRDCRVDGGGARRDGEGSGSARHPRRGRAASRSRRVARCGPCSARDPHRARRRPRDGRARGTSRSSRGTVASSSTSSCCATCSAARSSTSTTRTRATTSASRIS